MAKYEYRCETHGIVEVSLPIGTARPQWPCPECHEDAVRVFSAPLLSLAPRELVRLIDRTEKTRDEPEVVSSVPSAGARRRTPMAPPNPALRRLPRP